jgi:hypothetical protein
MHARKVDETGMKMRPARLAALAACAFVAGCGEESAMVRYVCEEPLAKYLDIARENIENDYEVERSGRVLSVCPDKGFHRRYTFAFPRSGLLSKQAVDAQVTAEWCSDPDTRKTAADLIISQSVLTFRFTYPWSTATGKYPRTEFRLNRNTLNGGFFEDLDWSCRLKGQD